MEWTRTTSCVFYSDLGKSTITIKTDVPKQQECQIGGIKLRTHALTTSRHLFAVFGMVRGAGRREGVYLKRSIAGNPDTNITTQHHHRYHPSTPSHSTHARTVQRLLLQGRPIWTWYAMQDHIQNMCWVWRQYCSISNLRNEWERVGHRQRRAK